MKKTLTAILSAAMILSLTACDGQSDDNLGNAGWVQGYNPQNSAASDTAFPADTSSKSETKPLPQSKPVPIPDIPETSAYAFSYNYNAYVGGIVIDDYLGDAKMIHIPSELDSKRSITVDLSRCYKPITHIVLPDYVINGVALSNGILATLKYMNIPNGYKEVPAGCFSGCENLESVTIADSVTDIKERAFSGCKSLVNLYIPHNVTSIGSRAFSGCESLKSLTIPDGVTTIGDDAFLNCNNIIIAYKGETYDYEHINDLYNAIRYDGNGMKIENGVLLEVSKELTSVEISDEATTIGDNAFSKCANLTSVVIPNSVTKIGSSAFSECTSLTSIVIPDSVTEIGLYAFSGCTSLTNIVIPDGMTTIDRGVFNECTSLTSIVIPDSVTTIGDNAFSKCANLTSVVIPDSMTIIDSDAFRGCEKLTNITYKGKNYDYDNIKMLYDAVNYGESGMLIKDGVLTGAAKSLNGVVVVPDGVTEIGSSAFWACDYITSVVLPDGLTKIGDNAFANCHGIISIVIPDGVTEIGDGAFNCCQRLESIAIPDSVQKIGKTTFSTCDSLTSATYKGKTYSYRTINTLYNQINYGNNYGLF